MQTHPQVQTRREFLGSLKPGWLRWKMIRALVYAAAVIGLIYVSASTVHELGFVNTIKTAGGFFALFVLVCLGSRVSGIGQRIFKQWPPSAKAFLYAFGRFSSYLIFGLCCIHVYERWRENGDIARVIIPLSIIFALQFLDELEKQNSTTQQR